MYIREIHLTNFRCFRTETSIEFKDGINVIIGHNNSGKSNFLKALALLFSSHDSKRLTVDDFNKKNTEDEIREAPPKIVISATFEESANEETYSDDLVTVSTWLIKLEKPYKAQITYEYYLPESEHDDYKKALLGVDQGDVNGCWKIIKEDFIRKYTHKLYVCNPPHKVVSDPAVLKSFDFQFVDAIRDVERDMFTGKISLLKEVSDCQRNWSKVGTKRLHCSFSSRTCRKHILGNNFPWAFFPP